MTATRAETEARRALFGSLIDHAPLFPPASLPLAEALEDHRRALASPESWLLSRFVCPASRLPELEGQPLRLTVVVDGPAGLAHVDERVEAVEGRDPGLTVLGLETYVEVAPNADLEPIRTAGARAKVRCGPTAPPVDELASFIRRSRAAGMTFKATAGLHHALPTDGQHGFLNLLAAAVFADEEEALAETDPEAFHVDSEFRWRDRAAGPREVAEVRRTLFTSIGSCSFSEPVEELHELGFL